MTTETTLKATELRVGNYVLKSGKPYRWGLMDFEEAACGDGEKVFDWFQPIPLSPEILEKAGFTYGMVEGVASFDEEQSDGDTEYWDKGRLTIVRWDKGDFTLSNAFSLDLRVTLHTVHQLQNLYFALVGEELEINLDGE